MPTVDTPYWRGPLATKACSLRNGPPLLHTVIDFPMRFSRLLTLLLFLPLVEAANLRAQEIKASPGPEAPKAVATVQPKTYYTYVHVDEPYIALTFDDGPHETLTPRLLDLLAKKHIKATFFVLGECVQDHREILARAAQEGHEIATHSWSHPQLNHMSDDAVRSQLKRTDDLIKSVTGRRPTLFRPPYGALTTKQKKWIPEEYGYKIILWDVDPLDWKDPGPATVTNRILRETRAGSIILSHDIHRGTVEAMPATIDQLLAKNYKFVTVSELIDHATPEPVKPKKPVPAGSPSSSAARVAAPTPAPAGSPPAVSPSPNH